MKDTHPIKGLRWPSKSRMMLKNAFSYYFLDQFNDIRNLALWFHFERSSHYGNQFLCFRGKNYNKCILEDDVLKYFLYFSELLFGMYVRYVESGIRRSVLHLLHDFHRLADANLRCFLLLYKGKWYLSSQ